MEGDVLNDHLLSVVTLGPTIFAILLLFIPMRYKTVHRIVTLLTSIVMFAFSTRLWTGFNPDDPSFQFVDRLAWIPQFGIEYHVGVDGVSLLLVLLTTLLLPVVVLAAWSLNIEHIKSLHITFLLLTTGMIGTFVALDLFLFYVFWEITLIPMYFIVGVWGGPRRIYAAVKFFVFTMAGSVFMLVAILYLAWFHHQQTGVWSYSYLDFLQTAPLIPSTGGLFAPGILVFAAFLLAFAIKIPIFPLHTWLPDAHVEAPSTGSVLLAGVLLKMGTYGLLRFNRALLPDPWEVFTPLLIVLAVIGIIYGALVAMVQPDVKKLVAYSSVSHLGFVVLGLAAGTQASTQGAILQMVNHGLTTGALFLLVGMLYERTYTRLIDRYGGLAEVMPIFTGIFLVVTLGSIGLPGLNGFVGEFLILAGSWGGHPVAVVFAGLGVILSAVYMLWMVQRVFWGPVDITANYALPDISLREIFVVAPLMVLIVWIGIHPNTFLGPMEASVRLLLTR
ncbi:MAG: NADH-quinone oxidoreductase subunit M [Acidobacteria bacterium]|nr:NADH-quinone oxidoreductase subunit M [Candidatus Sulfomarinibacter kjeldsenii]